MSELSPTCRVEIFETSDSAEEQELGLDLEDDVPRVGRAYMATARELNDDPNNPALVRRKESLVRQVRRLFRARVRHARACRDATIAVAAIPPSVFTPHPPPRAPRPTERERAAAATRSRRSSVVTEC